MKSNLFSFLQNIPKSSQEEIFQTIQSTDKIRIERIISYGQTTPDDVWYDQNEDEFVIVLEGEADIKYDDNTTYKLKQGDSLFIKAHQKHQVIFTSNPTIWLAIFS